jgi:hypothetical protein
MPSTNRETSRSSFAIARAYLAVAIMLGVPAGEYREIADALEVGTSDGSGAGHA